MKSVCPSLFDSSYISGGDVRIEKDPDMTKLAQEARRLSMGQNSPDGGGGGGGDSRPGGVGRRTSNTPPSTSAAAPSVQRNGSGPRRPSEGYGGSRDPIQ